MKRKIENKLISIVDYIFSKNPKDITKDEYDILSEELKRIVYNEEMKERNKKIAETMGLMIGVGFGSY